MYIYTFVSISSILIKKTCIYFYEQTDVLFLTVKHCLLDLSNSYKMFGSWIESTVHWKQQ